jgi:hypothetical protein
MPKRRSPTQLRKQIVTHLEDFPSQLEALEASMAMFGETFEPGQFKRAFNRESGIGAYARVQAVERGFSRVQNYMAQLALDGTELVGIDLPKIHEGEAARAFEALKHQKVISPALCRRLKKTQSARSAVEHDYLGMKAGEVHRAVVSTAAAARELIGPYARWITPYL